MMPQLMVAILLESNAVNYEPAKNRRVLLTQSMRKTMVVKRA